jgi:hypothetical protein
MAIDAALPICYTLLLLMSHSSKETVIVIYIGEPIQTVVKQLNMGSFLSIKTLKITIKSWPVYNAEQVQLWQECLQWALKRKKTKSSSFKHLYNLHTELTKLNMAACDYGHVGCYAATHRQLHITLFDCNKTIFQLHL